MSRINVFCVHDFDVMHKKRFFVIIISIKHKKFSVVNVCFNFSMFEFVSFVEIFFFVDFFNVQIEKLYMIFKNVLIKSKNFKSKTEFDNDVL